MAAEISGIKKKSLYAKADDPDSGLRKYKLQGKSVFLKRAEFLRWLDINMRPVPVARARMFQITPRRASASASAVG